MKLLGILPLLTALLLPHVATAQLISPFANQDEIPPQVDAMYQRGVRALIASQTPDGAWPDNFGRQPGVIGLAVMALLASGEDPNTGPTATTIQRALRNILGQQNQETGYIGTTMYNHAFATTALAEAYGEVSMDGLGPALQKAVDLILNAQKRNRQGAWRYGPDSNDADTSVAGAVLVALFAARNAGLEVPDEAFTKGLEYFDRMRTNGGGYGYTSNSAANFNRTAIGLLVFCLAGQHEKTHTDESLRFLSQNLNYRDSSYPFYFEYYMAQALFQKDLETWRKWNEINIRFLATTQAADGTWPGSKGACFSTSAALLSLALNYRFLPIYER